MSSIVTVGDFSYSSVILSLLSSVYGIMLLTIVLLPIIGSALIFKKAGISWWTAIIPFYNEYKMLELVDKKKWFIAYLLSIVGAYISAMIGSVFLVVAFFAMFADKVAMFIPTIILSFTICGVCSIILFIENCLKCIGITKKLNMPSGMAVGMIFLPAIFYMIAGASQKYQISNQTGYFSDVYIEH